jgi:phosphonate transport system ATP-binding protein
MIQIKNLTHIYDNKHVAVKDVNLDITEGELVILLGPSGSGKSTLLRCINKLINPSNGDVIIDGENIVKSPENDVNRIRQKIGMIFQQFNLIERSSVFDNVLKGRLGYIGTVESILGRYSKIDKKISQESLKRVGMDGFGQKRVSDLSGGEKQRVGIARALAQKPKMMLADEPVSNLDPKLMKEVLDLLQKICVEDKLTLVCSLHFLELAKKYATRIIGLKNGEIVFDNVPEELTEDRIVDIYGKTRDWYLYGKVGY